MIPDRTLHVNTSYLDETTRQELAKGNKFGIKNMFAMSYGFIMMPVHIRSAIDKNHPVPECISNIAQYALKKNCTLIIFDNEAEEKLNISLLHADDQSKKGVFLKNSR